VVKDVGDRELTPSSATASEARAREKTEPAIRGLIFDVDLSAGFSMRARKTSAIRWAKESPKPLVLFFQAINMSLQFV
jgi:hypothetical protein